jgi:hypothetical protein
MRPAHRTARLSAPYDWIVDSQRLRIEIVKRTDGAGVLRCTRPDGSVSWQKQPRHAAHFALHDLTHFAVETVLGCRRAFFGLVADGWDIEDTTGKGARGPLPEEAAETERIVGLFDAERACGVKWSATDFLQYTGRMLTDDEICRIRELRAELFRRWAAVPVGGALKLESEERYADTPSSRPI